MCLLKDFHWRFSKRDDSWLVIYPVTLVSVAANVGLISFSLCLNVYAEQFTKYFGRYGETTDSVIMKDWRSGKPRGYGFVTMQIRLWSIKSFKTLMLSMENKLYEFKDFFSKFGEVKEHQIIRDQDTSHSCGFGFVKFDDEQAVDDILANGNKIVLAGAQVSHECGAYYEDNPNQLYHLFLFAQEINELYPSLFFHMVCDSLMTGDVVFGQLLFFLDLMMEVLSEVEIKKFKRKKGSNPPPPPSKRFNGSSPVFSGGFGNAYGGFGGGGGFGASSYRSGGYYGGRTSAYGGYGGSEYSHKGSKFSAERKNEIEIATPIKLLKLRHRPRISAFVAFLRWMRPTEGAKEINLRCRDMQCGESVTIEGQTYTISAVTHRYQLRKGRYEPSEKRLDVQSTGRYILNLYLENLLEQS
ncbi:hypothetical protein HHK36_007451 [Tetracentron sinense]|uniref:RRM domain-containing protein n=1 Tax=Tetracentron sinense TaxID=13715 RepID=A0A835DLA1_TETSI|nr:hypothetical protein HHK36_007451 [Tetracentron sinense]